MRLSASSEAGGTTGLRQRAFTSSSSDWCAIPHAFVTRLSLRSILFVCSMSPSLLVCCFIRRIQSVACSATAAVATMVPHIDSTCIRPSYLPHRPCADKATLRQLWCAFCSWQLAWFSDASALRFQSIPASRHSTLRTTPTLTRLRRGLACLRMDTRKRCAQCCSTDPLKQKRRPPATARRTQERRLGNCALSTGGSQPRMCVPVAAVAGAKHTCVSRANHSSRHIERRWCVETSPPVLPDHDRAQPSAVTTAKEGNSTASLCRWWRRSSRSSPLIFMRIRADSPRQRPIPRSPLCVSPRVFPAKCRPHLCTAAAQLHRTYCGGRSSQTETSGISLMDFGSASFVFSNGIVASPARNDLRLVVRVASIRWYTQTCWQ